MAEDEEDMIGHNSINATDTGEILRMQIEKIERLEEEKQNIADDIKDVFAFLKSSGFDVKTVKRVIALRKMERQQREEQEALLETYLAALGML